jgi:hypothetical protein
MHHEHRNAVLVALANQLLGPRPTTSAKGSEVGQRSKQDATASERVDVQGAASASARRGSLQDQHRVAVLLAMHAELGIHRTQRSDDAVVASSSSDDESEAGAPPQEVEEEEEEEEEEVSMADALSERARTREEGRAEDEQAPSSKSRVRARAPQRVHHSRHMLSQALADAVADRGAYPLGAHERDAHAPTGRRFVPWLPMVTGPQEPPLALAADDAPWTELWASDPRAVGRLRPLTDRVGRSLAQTAAQHKTVLSDTAREYGERKIKASICGPHSREGDREGGEGRNHKRQLLEDLGAGSKKRYATSIKTRGAPARALTKTELYAKPRPATKKHLVSQRRATRTLPFRVARRATPISSPPHRHLHTAARPLPPEMARPLPPEMAAFLPPTPSPPTTPPPFADPNRRPRRQEAVCGDLEPRAGGAIANGSVY